MNADLIRADERRRCANFAAAYAARIRARAPVERGQPIDADTVALAATMIEVLASAMRADICDPEENWPVTADDARAVAAAEVA